MLVLGRLFACRMSVLELFISLKGTVSRCNFGFFDLRKDFFFLVIILFNVCAVFLCGMSKVAVSTNREVEGHIPNYPNLPPQLICQLHEVTMHVSCCFVLFVLSSFSGLLLDWNAIFRQIRKQMKSMPR